MNARTAATARAREPSTWAGLAVLLALAGVEVAPEQLAATAQLLATLAGAAAVLLPERTPPKEPTP